jgi:hypothetical protein
MIAPSPNEAGWFVVASLSARFAMPEICEFREGTAKERTSFIIQTQHHAGELAYYRVATN